MIKYAKWFWKYYRYHKRALAVLLTLSLAVSALMVIQPILLKNIFDLLKSGETRPINLPYVNAWIQSMAGGKITNYVLMLIAFGTAGFVARTILIGHRAYMNIRVSAGRLQRRVREGTRLLQ